MNGVAHLDVGPGEADIRLDRWFSRHYPGLSHGRLERLLRTGQVRVDGRRVRAGTRLSPGQTVRVPPLDHAAAETGKAPRRGVSQADGDWIRSLVLHDDEDLLVLNKPSGIAVQGGSRTARHVDGFLDAFGGAERPRLVHRLDRDTSGVLLIARHAAAAAALAQTFRRRGARKVYWALVAGVPRPRSGTMDRPLAKVAGGDRRERVKVREDAGKPAVTRYRTVEAAGRRVSWLELVPVTGRTHQLRVHCAEAGIPILGDRKYGADAPSEPSRPTRLHLHARALEIPHPSGGMLNVEAPLDEALESAWRSYGFEPEAL